MNKSIKKIIEDKNYLTYFFSTAFSMSSSNILQFVLALYILKLTGSPVVYASILSIIIFPRILLTPFAGVIGDKLKRINIIKTLTIFQLIIMIVYSVYSNLCLELSLISVYLLVIVLEAIEVFYQAAESAILGEIVQKDLMEEAVTLSRLDDGIVYIITPLLGALIYNRFGISGSFILISLFLFISVLLNIFIKTPYETKKEKTQIYSFKVYIEEFTQGLNIIRDNKFARVFIVVAPMINFSFSAIFSVVITYLFLHVFDIGEYMYGIYRAINSGVALVLPLLVLPIVKKVEPDKLLKYTSISISFLLFLIAVSTYFGSKGNYSTSIAMVWIITFLGCLIICCVMPLNIATQVFFQKNIENQYRSRVMSVFRMLTLSSIPFGNMFYGFLVEFLPPYICILIASFLVFLTFPMTLTFLKK